MDSEYTAQIAQIEAQLGLEKYGMKPRFFEWAEGKWEAKVRDDPTPGMPGIPPMYPKACYHNATEVAKAIPSMQIYAGYAIDPEFPIPLEHAWNVDADGNVHDFSPAWQRKTNVFYYGVPIPVEMAAAAVDSEAVDFFYAVQRQLPQPTKSSFVDLASPPFGGAGTL